KLIFPNNYSSIASCSDASNAEASSPSTNGHPLVVYFASTFVRQTQAPLLARAQPNALSFRIAAALLPKEPITVAVASSSSIVIVTPPNFFSTLLPTSSAGVPNKLLPVKLTTHSVGS